MKAIVLAAGTGSRLKHMTRELPKAMIPLAGKPLLAYALGFARELGCDRFEVVTGAHQEKVETFLGALSLPGLSWVHNPRFLLGNIFSLGAALGRVEESFLLLNTDHVYDRRIASRLQAQCQTELVAFCDQDRPLGQDDMKAKADERGRLLRISKQLTEFDRGYVGMTYCPREALPTYRKAFDEVVQRVGDSAVVEMILGHLAEQRTPPLLGDISGVGWLEIDTPEEHACAEIQVREHPERYAVIA